MENVYSPLRKVIQRASAGLIMLLLGCFTLFGQSGVHSSGGQASGTNGTIDFSVGQLVYTFESGEEGSTWEGVQQPFEISVVTNISEGFYGVEASVYPNPTNGMLRIELPEDLGQVDFHLYNMNGQLVKKGQSEGPQSELSLTDLPSGAYLLGIFSKDVLNQQFTIIKN